MDDTVQSSTDHRGLKLQNIIQKLSEHCDIKNPEQLETNIDDEALSPVQKEHGNKRKRQDTSDIGGLTINGSSSDKLYSTTDKSSNELTNKLELKCNSKKSNQQEEDSCKVAAQLPRERISARLRSLKSKKMVYEEDWVDPDQIRLSGKKIPIQSSKNSSHNDNAKPVTQKRKRRKKQTVQSMEEYVNESPLIQVGNLVGLRQCRLCAVMFVEKEQLINHMKAVHHLNDKINVKMEPTESSQNEEKASDEKPFKCLQCDSSFRKSSGLKQHVTRQHPQNMPQKTNQSQTNQGYSRRGTNSNDRPYVCQVCGKAFKRKHHLQEHSYIHSDDKPYKCDTCSKTFNQRICLTKHLPCREHEKQHRKPSCTDTANALGQEPPQVTNKLSDVKVPDVICTESRSACCLAPGVDSLSSYNLHINGNECDKTHGIGVSFADHSQSPHNTESAVNSQDSTTCGSKVALSVSFPGTSATSVVTVNDQTCSVRKSIETSREETAGRILKQQN